MPARVIFAVIIVLAIAGIAACAGAADRPVVLNWEAVIESNAVRALAVDERDGSIYVHSGVDAVLKYDEHGKFLATIGPEVKDSSGNIALKLSANTPAGLAVDPLTGYLYLPYAGYIHVIDASGRVVVWKYKFPTKLHNHLSFSSDGMFLYAAGSGPFRGAQEFKRSLNGAAQDHTDDTFADSGLEINACGEFPPASYADPRGCTVDADSMLYVTDLADGRHPVRRYEPHSNRLNMEFYTGAYKSLGCSTDPHRRFWIADIASPNSRLVRAYLSGIEVFSFDPSNGGKMMAPELVAYDGKRNNVIIVGKGADASVIQSWSVNVPAPGTGELSGRIVDSGSGKPVQAAFAVIVRRQEPGGSSDSAAFYQYNEGEYKITLPAGSYRISASASGYMKPGSGSIECKVESRKVSITPDIALISLEKRRAKDRTAYKPVQLAPVKSPRQVIDLTGKWLFKPLQELTDAGVGGDPAIDDAAWHVLTIPQFWGYQDWAKIDGNTSFNRYFREQERCSKFTFDYNKTDEAWYRQWVSVPGEMRGKRFVLKFDGVASISRILWNGRPVGGHVGMFGPFECEVTPYVKYGEKNLLAVYVSRGKISSSDPKKQVAVAVTVNITQDMINGIPHGYFFETTGGIWQPVKLEITGPDKISDVFFRPKLNGATIETTLDRRDKEPVEVRHIITDAASGSVIYRDVKSWKPAAGDNVVRTTIGGLKPKLWFPEHPNLYELKTQLLSRGRVVDQTTTTVGFRTFEVRGPKLYLNGKSYFLRGSNVPPIGLGPCDKALANNYLKLMHDGNQMITRFHSTPVGHAWLDAADKQGVGVSIEGHWPWLLIGDTAIPSRELIELWKTETLEYERAYRNHPSILMWTLSNENYFNNDKNSARKAEKYRIFSDLAKKVRQVSPDLPVVLFSGYKRFQDDYNKIVKPNKLDDGDIDDRHYYFSWYGGSVFYTDIIGDIESKGFDDNRPLISQEHGLPYTDMDDGYPNFTHQKQASAWVGGKAFYTARPDSWKQMQAQIIKESAEKIRRDRQRIVGWHLFSTFAWIKNGFDADNLDPQPTYWAVKQAWQPVLVSLETANRHFMAGQRFSSNVVVANDDIDRPMLRDLTLEWRIHGRSTTDTTFGLISFPDCAYDSRARGSVSFEVPTEVPMGRSEMTLELVLMQGSEVVSRNTYPLICASQNWVSIDADARKLLVLETDTKASEYLEALGAECESARSIDWKSIGTDRCVVIAHGIDKVSFGSAADFGSFISRGGRILMLEPAPKAGGTAADTVLSALPWLPIEQVNIDPVGGEFVEILSDILLDGVDPMDVRWFSAAPGEFVKVCRTSYRFPDGIAGVTKLASHIAPHGYISDAERAKRTSSPIFEVTAGRGRALVSSILLADDPIAKRLMRNMLVYLSR